MRRPASTYSRAAKARPSRGATSSRPGSTCCPRVPPRRRDPAQSCPMRTRRTGRLARLRPHHHGPYGRPGLGRALVARPVPGTSHRARRRVRACACMRPSSKDAARALRLPLMAPLPSFRSTRVCTGAPRASQCGPTCALQAARVPRALRRRGFSRCRRCRRRRHPIRLLCLPPLCMRPPQRNLRPVAPLPLQLRPLRGRAARRGRPQRGAAASVHGRRPHVPATHAPPAASGQRASLLAASTYPKTCRLPFARNGAAPTHALSWTWLMRSSAPTIPKPPRK